MFVSFVDYFKFWLKSIDSFSDTESPVIIVGTHADKLSKEVSKTKDTIFKKNYTLKSIFMNTLR